MQGLQWAHGLKAKLTRSHLSVALIGVILLVISLSIFIWIKETTQALIEINTVSLQQAENVRTGLQKSLAALRGWMAIPDKKFITERESAWKEDIIPNIDRFEAMLKNHPDQRISQLTSQLIINLADLRAWQWHIQDVAQTPGNHIYNLFLEKNIEPSAQRIISMTTTLIDMQMLNTGTKQVAILKKLADFRGFFTSALASGASYIASNKYTDLKKSESGLRVASKRMRWLALHEPLLLAKQRLIFNLLNVRYENYHKTFQHLLRKKQSTHYDSLANKWLSTLAVPLARQTEVILNAIISTEMQKKNSKANLVSTLISIMIYVVFIFIILLLVSSYYLASRNAKKIIFPINSLLDATKRMAQGRLATVIEVSSQDEIGELTKSFNAMWVQRQESEDKIQQTIETAVDCILTINVKGIIQSCNTATLDFFGYSKEDLVGNNVAILMPDPHHSKHNDYINHYLETGITNVIGRSRELEAKLKSGELTPIMLSVSEVKIGSQHYFTGIIRDIRREKQQEKEMHKLNETLEKDNFEKTMLSDFENRLRGLDSVDLFAEEVLLYLADFFQSPLLMFYDINPETQAVTVVRGYGFKERRNRATAFPKGETLVGECIHSKKIIILSDPPQDYIKVSSGMGEALPKQIIILPIMFEDNVLSAIELCVFEVMSEENQQRLKRLCDSAAIYFNLLRSKINLQTLLSEAEKQKHYLEQQEEELRSSNEELESQAAALKQNEEELRATNEELHTQVSLIETQKQKISLKSEELERVSQYKSEFLANMSHELRTPLNSLLILAQGFLNNRKGNLTSEQLEEAGIIYESGNDLLALINDILDISKIEAGQLTIEILQLELFDIIETLKRQFTPIAKNKNLKLLFEWDKENTCDDFYSDQLRLLQILKNLLSNAIKFTATGSVTLKVACDSTTITFKVIDTGIGIASDKQELVFSEFQQADGSTSRKYGGTGLGLSISKKLASLMQGTLSLESAEGEGSTFILTIPINPERSSDKEVVSHKIVPSTSSKEPCHLIESPKVITDIPNEAKDERDTLDPSQPTLLIIDDDEKFCQMLAKSIRDNNFQTLMAYTGYIGLQLAVAYQPCGILLDLGLPDISGEDVLKLLKEDARTCDIPVHIVSARDKSESIFQGAYGVLQKPVKEEDIINVLSLISGSREKSILFVEDDLIAQRGIKEVFSSLSDHVSIEFATTVEQAKTLITKNQYTCVIVDLSLPDASGITLLEVLVDEMQLVIPIIVYTARDLTPGEHKRIAQYTGKVIIKGERAIERLLDEVSLFLNHVTSNKSDLTTPLTQLEYHFEGKSILLVDDDLRNTFALSRTLEAEGFAVAIADNGQLAIEKLQSDTSFDIILMDMMMPVMDGGEVILRIRQMNQFKDIPIIALTARATEKDRAYCIEAGANDYMSKPLDVAALLKLIDIWLTK